MLLGPVCLSFTKIGKFSVILYSSEFLSFSLFSLSPYNANVIMLDIIHQMH